MDDDYFDMIDEQGAWEASLSAEAEARAEADAFEALQQRVAELEAALHWLLSLFHMRHDDAGWRVVMREYPPSPEDAQRIGELAARYGVAVSVAQNDAPEPEPLPGTPAAEAEMPENPLDWLASLKAR